jgi:hypothetical protein
LIAKILGGNSLNAGVCGGLGGIRLIQGTTKAAPGAAFSASSSKSILSMWMELTCSDFCTAFDIWFV